MDSLLIVDSDKRMVLDLAETLHQRLRFEVLTAFDSKTAVDILNNQPVSLLMCGFHLPDFDGIELLAYMTRAFPAIPCIAMMDAGHPRPWFIPPVGQDHVLEFMERPVDGNAAAALAEHCLNLKQKGAMESGMRMRNFLPLMDAFKKSCQMDVRSDKKNRGRMYFLRGCLIEAHCEAKIGEAALEEMLQWTHCKISISRLPSNKKEDLMGIALMTRIGATWERKTMAPEIPPVTCVSETIPPDDAIQELPLDPVLVARLESAVKKYSGVLKTIKGYQGMAVLSKNGRVIASDFTQDAVDFAAFSSDFTRIFNQCSGVSDRQGFQRCTGFTAHTEKGIILMISAGEYHFIALMAPDGNGFFMQVQLEKIIPQILRQ